VAAPMLGSYLFDMMELRPEEQGPLLLSDVSTLKTKEALLAYWEADRVVKTNDEEAFDIWNLADKYHLDWLRLNYAGGALRHADAHNRRLDFLPHLQGIQLRTLGGIRMEPLPDKLLPVLGRFSVALTLDDIGILLTRVDAGMREVYETLSFKTDADQTTLYKFDVKTSMGTIRRSEERSILTLKRRAVKDRYYLYLLGVPVLDTYLIDKSLFNVHAQYGPKELITAICRHAANPKATIMGDSTMYHDVLQYLAGTLSLQQPGPDPPKEEMFKRAILLFNRTVGVHGHRLDIRCNFPYACGEQPIYEIRLRDKLILSVEWTHWPRSLKDAQGFNAHIKRRLEKGPDSDHVQYLNRWSDMAIQELKKGAKHPMFTIVFMETIKIPNVELPWSSVWHPYSLLAACFECYSTLYTQSRDVPWWEAIQNFILLVHAADNMFRRSFVDLAE